MNLFFEALRNEARLLSSYRCEINKQHNHPFSPSVIGVQNPKQQLSHDVTTIIISINFIMYVTSIKNAQPCFMTYESL